MASALRTGIKIWLILLWALLALLICAALKTAGKLSVTKAQNIGRYQNIREYLLHPDSLRLMEMFSLVIRDDFKVTDNGKVTAESERLTSILSKKPVIDYVLYAADTAEYRLVIEGFIFIDGEPMASFAAEESASSATKLQFSYSDKSFKELVASTVNKVILESEGPKYDVISMVTATEMDAYLNVAMKIRMISIILIAAIVSQVAYLATRSKKRANANRQPGSQLKFGAFGVKQEAAIDLIERMYPSHMLPESYGEYKINKKKCYAWIQSNALYVMQTKSSLLKRASVKAEDYDTEEKFKMNIFARRISLQNIIDFSYDEEKGYLAYYKEMDETKTLVFDEKARDFVESLRERLM
jgi:hypothetical protein